MKLTNIHNLPEPFVDLVTFDNYSKGKSDFTTTEIIGPPKANILRRRHDDELEEDVCMRVWAMSGSAKHYLLEQIAHGKPERYIAEDRMYKEVHGKILGGMIDLYDKLECVLYDYKETKVWKVTKGDTTDWTAQANINLWLMRGAGYQVNEVRYIAFLKDWTDRDTGREGYPQTPLVVVPLEIWPEAKTKAYIEERVRLHMNFREVPDDSIPACSKDERWEGDGYFIVKHEENKRATKKFPNDEFPLLSEAKMRAQTLASEMNRKKKGYEVLEVTAEPTRCLRYCPANRFCAFFQAYQKNHQIAE